MKTYIINSIEDLKQFEGDGGYSVDGNLEVNCSLDIKNKNLLSVDGYLSLKSDRYIKRYIRVGGSITAREYIMVDGYIYADGSIIAIEFIKAAGSITAHGCIDSGGYIDADGFISSSSYINADSYIKSGEFIRTGYCSGIKAELSISCKGNLYCGDKILAGTCVRRKITDKEKTITCYKLEGGIVAHGILVETGEDDSKTQEALELLKSKGYKIIKQ